MPETEPPKKKKIAILGGGMGALSTAYELTSYKDWADSYQVTVYQLGWRLGGKCASGRGIHGRIEEHGIHVFLGFYDNAFRMMRDVYEELIELGLRKPTDPLATWEQAFKPQHRVVMPEYVDGCWLDWLVDFAPNDLEPGTPGRDSIWDYIHEIIEAMLSAFVETAQDRSTGCLGQIWHRVTAILGAVVAFEAGELISKLEEARDLARQAPAEKEHHDRIIELLEAFFESFLQEVESDLEEDPGIRRLAILLELGYRNIVGILTDVLPSPEKFGAINHYDYREWLRKFDTSELALNSAAIQLIYNLPFAYPKGDTTIQGKIAAGAALYGILRIVFDYKGAPMWKFQAGTGDTVVAPLYLVLKKRGVNFEFFQRVKKLHVDDDQRISGISVGRQVNLKAPNQGYEPLKPVQNLPSWPAQPRYEQIVEGEELKAEHIDLESYWTPWSDVEERDLKVGEDFDPVVLGISLGALPDICAELIERSEAWHKLVKTNQTNQTQALQLWLKKDWAGLGSPWSGVVAASYVNPINSWADMSQLIEHEDWPANNKPGSIAYLCGPMADAALIPPPTEHNFPASQSERVKQMALQWLAGSTEHLWPKAVLPGLPDLNYGLLVNGCDPAEPGDFRAQFEAQFWRANIDPSERYVLSLPKSIEHRLEPGNSGFGNLYLAGDWVRNHLNIGSVEGAVMSGLGAAHAIRRALNLPVDKEVLGIVE